MYKILQKIEKQPSLNINGASKGFTKELTIFGKSVSPTSSVGQNNKIVLIINGVSNSVDIPSPLRSLGNVTDKIIIRGNTILHIQKIGINGNQLFVLTEHVKTILSTSLNIALKEGNNTVTLNDSVQTTMSCMYNQPITPKMIENIKNNTPVLAYLEFFDDMDENVITINQDNYLKKYEIEDFRYIPSEGIFGSCIANKVTIDFVNVENTMNFQDKNVRVFLGVLDTSGYRYLDYGTYIVQKPENENTTDSNTIVALDYMIKFNVDFPKNIVFPITKKNLLITLCNRLGFVLGTETFRNMDFVIEANPFVGTEKGRDIDKAIGQTAFSWIRVFDNIVYVDFGVKTEVVDRYTNDDYYQEGLVIQDAYGEVNRVTLGMSQVEGENLSVEDIDSITKNGLTEVIINDNPFAYSQQKRQELIEAGRDIFGFKYLPINMRARGFVHLNSEDLIEVVDMQGLIHTTYVFNHTIIYDGVVNDELVNEAMTKAETKYLFTPPMIEAQKRTELLVDKANQTIVATVERIDNDYWDKYTTSSVITQTVEGLNIKISESTTPNLVMDGAGVGAYNKTEFSALKNMWNLSLETNENNEQFKVLTNVNGIVNDEIKQEAENEFGSAIRLYDYYLKYKPGGNRLIQIGGATPTTAKVDDYWIRKSSPLFSDICKYNGSGWVNINSIHYYTQERMNTTDLNVLRNGDMWFDVTRYDETGNLFLKKWNKTDSVWEETDTVLTSQTVSKAEQFYIKVEPELTYNISYKVKNMINTGQLVASVKEYNQFTYKTPTEPQKETILATFDASTINTWFKDNDGDKTLIIDFKPMSETKTMAICFLFNPKFDPTKPQAPATEETNGEIWITDVMVKKHNGKVAWSQNANEINEQNIKMDKLGIRVFNNNSNTYTLMDDDEFSIKNANNNNTLWTATPTGTKQKESEVTDKQTIGYCVQIPTIKNGKNALAFAILKR